MQLNLVKTPHPALHLVTKPIKKVDNKIKQIVQAMKQILNQCKNPVGVGLAGPQVGLNLQIFIIKPNPKDKISCFINPKIISKSKKIRKDKSLLEGCLSIHNTWGNVFRHQWVELEYLDEQGNKQKKRFENWEAQIIQHEMDHLKGLLFTQRALNQGNQLYRLINKLGKEEFEPIEI